VDGDENEPGGGWFQATNPPPEPRSDGPLAVEQRTDPMFWVLAAIALAVVVILGGYALFG
jgi:hypothetical protein